MYINLEDLDAEMETSRVTFEDKMSRLYGPTPLFSKDNKIVPGSPGSDLKINDEILIETDDDYHPVKKILVGFEYIWSMGTPHVRYLATDRLDPKSKVKAYFQEDFKGKV